LRQQLEQVGSTECLLTWREKVTPAGRSLSQLVPLTRLIEEIECGLWPTPQHRENGGGEYADPEKARARITSGHQVNLQDHVKALWATPTSRDHKDGSYTPNVEVNALLGRQVWSGSPEQMEKLGALNPAFVCWLMGFPPEWDACAPTATPSSRKSRLS
jgi:hypothetical protein